MRNIIIKILFGLLKIPMATKPIDSERMKDWVGLQYPLKEFRDYIASRNLQILQTLGQGVMKNEDYWVLVGQRIELGRLLSEAKRNFEITDKAKKKNENTKNKKG
jgi:hypothetical protein